MPNSKVPTHWHVVDMLHAGVPSEATVSIEHDQHFEARLKNQPADEDGESLPLRPDEGRGIAQLLGQMHKDGDEVIVEGKHPDGRTLRHYVTCPRFSAISESDIANNRSASAVAELRVAADGGAPTLLKVKLRWVNRGGDCWLNMQGNPTSLLAGTNVFAAATGLAVDRERLYLLRFPFLFLRRVLRAVDPAFRWSDATAARIKSGEFSLHNVQLAMYLPFAGDGELRRFLRWLRAVYCTPIVDERWSSFLLGEYIGLRVEAISDARGDPTGVMFRAFRNAAGNTDLAVNFYDKLAALGEAGTALLGRPQRDWLAKHLRVDITLHPPAIGRLFTAAGLPRTRPTAAAWCRALAEFPGGEDGFRGWLLQEALATKLKLPAVAGFRPGLLEAARDKLSGRPRTMAVWDDWVAGRGDLRQLLQARLLDPAAVRAEIRAVRHAGLDPDLPPSVLHRLAMISSLWGFSAGDARRYSAALAAGDWRALRVLLRQNRAFVARRQRGFSRMVDAAFRPAPVPVLPAR
jgi:hypothetical protein